MGAKVRAKPRKTTARKLRVKPTNGSEATGSGPDVDQAKAVLQQEIAQRLRTCQAELDAAVASILEKHGCQLDIGFTMSRRRGLVPHMTVLPAGGGE